MTRSHRRRLVLPTVAAALALPVGLISACSAGQRAATSEITAAVPGVQATVQAGGSPDYTIQVANATVDFNGPQGYAKGDNAALSLWIFNNTPKDITLTGVRSDDGQVFQSVGAAPGAPSVCQSSPRPIQANPSTGAPTAGVAPSPGASGGASPQGPTGTPSNASSAKPTASSTSSVEPSVTPSAVESSAAPVGSAEINITVKSDGCVALTRASGQFLQIANLTNPLAPGKTVGMFFTFKQAGGGQFTIGSDPNGLAIPVGVPSSPDARTASPVPAETE